MPRLHRRIRSAPRAAAGWATTITVAILGLYPVSPAAFGAADPMPRAAPASAPSATSRLIPIASDEFDRRVTTGWGSADGGGNYLTSSSSFAVHDGKGWMDDLRPGRSGEVELPAATATNVLVRGTVVLPAGGLSGGGLYHALEARRQRDGSAYLGKVHIRPGGAMTLEISRLVGDTETRIGMFPVASKADRTRIVNVEFEVTGTSTVTLMVRAWPATASAGPWHSATDSSDHRITSKGAIGVRNYVSRSAGTMSVAEESFHVSSLDPVVATIDITVSRIDPAAPTTLVSTNFDDQPVGAVSPKDLFAPLGSTSTWAPAYDDMSIVRGGDGHGNVLRTTLDADTIRSRPAGNNGAALVIALPASLDRACLSYDVRFGSDFEWSLGGKLPGLSGVAPGVPPTAPAGGHPTPGSWSGRLMWLGPKAYSWAGPNNMIVSYMYHPGQAGQYGDNVRWNRSFTAGRWYSVKQCYRMNDVGRSDGALESWLDGRQVLDIHNFVYRDRDDVHINDISWSVFRGGDTMSWASSRTGTIDIDNVKVTDG